jgi:hypothetical protein
MDHPLPWRVWEREAFASSDDIRRATRLLDLVLAIFFTAVPQRICLRAWLRPHRPASQASRSESRVVQPARITRIV